MSKEYVFLLPEENWKDKIELNYASINIRGRRSCWLNSNKHRILNNIGNILEVVKKGVGATSGINYVRVMDDEGEQFSLYEGMYEEKDYTLPKELFDI